MSKLSNIHVPVKERPDPGDLIRWTLGGYPYVGYLASFQSDHYAWCVQAGGKVSLVWARNVKLR